MLRRFRFALNDMLWFALHDPQVRNSWGRCADSDWPRAVRSRGCSEAMSSQLAHSPALHLQAVQHLPLIAVSHAGNGKKRLRYMNDDGGRMMPLVGGHGRILMRYFQGIDV